MGNKLSRNDVYRATLEASARRLVKFFADNSQFNRDVASKLGAEGEYLRGHIDDRVERLRLEDRIWLRRKVSKVIRVLEKAPMDIPWLENFSSNQLLWQKCSRYFHCLSEEGEKNEPVIHDCLVPGLRLFSGQFVAQALVDSHLLVVQAQLESHELQLKKNAEEIRKMIRKIIKAVGDGKKPGSDVPFYLLVGGQERVTAKLGIYLGSIADVFERSLAVAKA